MAIQSDCVNLPRWGLKRPFYEKGIIRLPRVNLPRWGLKQFVKFQSGAETERV